MELHITLLLLAALLVVVSLIQPLAGRLGVNASILVAVVGVAIGLGASLAGSADPESLLARVFVQIPASSGVFIYVFLPLLLFQSSLNINLRRILEDSAPILLLAVIAVVVETLVIGFSLSWVAPVSLVACLLLGSIVSTTDPVAVVGIFRDVGAPSRLGRLLEGESLLNDAAAITLFTVLLDILVGSHSASGSATVLTFIRNFLGGAALGWAGTRVTVALLGWLPDLRLAQITLTLSLPYAVFILGEQYLAVSGVMAAVVAGLAMNTIGQPRMAPADWQFMRDLWQQLDFWASSLIFILAALLVPKLMVDIGPYDWLLLGVLLASSLTARSLTLFGLLPALSLLKLSQPIGNRFKVVILWGGLRGATTLALGLAVTENPLIGDDVQRFIAILATGFVLATLFVNGTTLKLLIGLLGLDRLSTFDRALREQVLALSRGRVADSVRAIAQRYQFAPEVTRQVTDSYRNEARAGAAASATQPAGHEEGDLLLGLLALATHERELILGQFGEQTVAGRIVEELLTDAGRMVDRTRARGSAEYMLEAQRSVGFKPRFRTAHLLHRRLHIDGPLVDALGDRFERLLVSRIVQNELVPYVDDKLLPLVGAATAGRLRDILRRRQEMTSSALQALRVQHPDYGEQLERRFLQKVALRREELEYRTLFQDGVIGPELYSALRREVQAARATLSVRPRLDLGLDARLLVGRVPMFAMLSEPQVAAVARLLQPRFAVPDEVLIRQGARGDSMYFISSGAVEVDAVGHRIRLERGDFFGEMALLTGEPRQATVRAATYCQLLVLHVEDFRRLLRSSRTIRAEIDRVAEARQRMNDQARAEQSGTD